MKLTPSRARELSGKGVSVNMAKVIRTIVKEVATVAPSSSPELPAKETPAAVVEAKTDDRIVEELKALAKSNEAASKALMASLKELSKPKPPKKWHCTVGRDVRGVIQTMDIVER